MDHYRIDALTQSLAILPSRRDVLRGLAGVGPGLGSLRFADIADAKKKRKHKHRKQKPKVKPNEFGCLDVGDACQDAEQCCSGICEGKKGKRTCRAHDTGTCNQDGPLFAPCNNRSNCGCFGTTAGSFVCAELNATADVCADCQTDTDCLALGFPPGSACAPFAECKVGTACKAPC